MTITSNLGTLELSLLSIPDTRDALIDEARIGLGKRPRSLAPWMLYDAEGSRLFECITRIPEYYPTRTERNILATYATAMISGTCLESHPLRLVELGAGTAAKTCILLKAAMQLGKEVVYHPIDVSPDALAAACESVSYRLPAVRQQPLVANYVTSPPKLDWFRGTTIAMYVGSSIGNFSPGQARTILRNLRSELREGDALLLGTDLIKDERTLVRAYDDSAGVTAAFNLNILRRLNRELCANFDLECFRHLARWNRAESRMEMHLESTCDQLVEIPAARLKFCLSPSETIHTESSYKFTRETLDGLIEDGGFRTKQVWTDSLGWYALTLASVR